MNKLSTLILVFFLYCVASYAQTGLSINEFDYDQPSGDTAEFLELFNSSANAIDLSLYSILLINGNNNTPYDTIALPSQMLNPASFFVICGNGGFVPNCDMQIPVSSNIIQNGAPDAMAIIETGTGNIIDAVSYEGTVAPPYFETTGVDTAKYDPGNVPYLGLYRFPDGQDSNNNDFDFNLVCITPGAANTNTQSTCAVGIANVNKEVKLINVYPNPSHGLVFVDYSATKTRNASITVHNVIGAEILSLNITTISSIYPLNLTNYSEGVYYVTVKTDGIQSTQRLIIRK
jgi:hypothetical protein